MESTETNHRPGKTSSIPRYTKPESVKILEQLALQNLKARYPSNPYLPIPKYTDATSKKTIKCIVDYIGFNGLQAKIINSTGFFKDNRKTEIDVLGHKRTVGSVQFVKTNTKDKFYNISSTIKGQKVKILIKSSPKASKNQDSESIGSIKQIASSDGLFLIVENFSQFYNWLNQFLKD